MTVGHHRLQRHGLGVFCAGLGLGLGVAIVHRSFRRVEVNGRSMVPALFPGDRLLVLRAPFGYQPWPRPGTVVAVRDPRDPTRTLVKRVSAVDRSAGTFEVLGDAPASSDSRVFGPLYRASLEGRALYRYAPAMRSGPVPRPTEYHRSR